MLYHPALGFAITFGGQLVAALLYLALVNLLLVAALLYQERRIWGPGPGRRSPGH